MRINLKQIFILLIVLIIFFPPVNYEEGYKYGSKDQVISDRDFDGFKFIYFVLTNNSISGGRYNIWAINYPFLILELIILLSVFLFFYLGKTKEEKKIDNKKQINKSKFNPFILTNNIFQKFFIYIEEQNRRSLFWATVAILTIVIYALEFFTGVSKLILSLF